MPYSIARLALVGSIFAVSSSVALAQNASVSASAAASQPRTAIAVPPLTAAVAASNAVPRADVATVVRTGPTAADKVKELTHHPKTNRTTQASMPSGAASASAAASR